MKKSRLVYFLTVTLIMSLVISCTNLEISATDSVITQADASGSTFNGVADVESALNGAFSSIAGTLGDQANLFALNEVTTDASLIPTRGTDWGDNGLWRQLHQHEWSAQQQFVETVWNNVLRLQLNASEILDEKSNATAEQAAQAYFIRAWSHFIILDLYGQVPIRDVNLGLSANPEVFSGAEMVGKIISDLDNAISGLTTTVAGSGDANGKVSKAAARYLKAKVLLNKFILDGSGNPDPADMASVIALVDQIATDGYALESGYFNIFREFADSETIWWVNTGVGNRIYNGLHYNQAFEADNSGGGWNGFSTLAEYYDLFEGDPNNNRLDAAGNAIDGQEERRGGVPPVGMPVGAPGTSDSNSDGFADGGNVGDGFLMGQQYSHDGSQLQDRQGNPLFFSREFVDRDGNPNLINNDEKTGIRIIKYNPRWGSFISHEVYFRYADAHLMKAEAAMRSGGDPTALINELRVIRGATPLGSVSAQDVLDERGRELYAEHWRRQDMLRFGQYTRDWEFKAPSAISDPNRNLFPIPLNQLVLNPNLTQNPGY